MSASLTILRAGPLTTIQDEGRFGMLRHGISASGPMDRGGFDLAGLGGLGAVEITMAGIELKVIGGACHVGFAGGRFKVRINGQSLDWPGFVEIQVGDVLAITPGGAGNYGYVRFDRDILVAQVMGSIATSSRAGLGGLEGRALRAGDLITLSEVGTARRASPKNPQRDGPIRVVWGLHADLFDPAVREKFLAAEFIISTRMDRMGVRLDDRGGVFAKAAILSLVSDAIVPGDIQILGDGTPIVLMRDHQPTGGYPRIATVITADLDRFAQLRAGTSVAFVPVSVAFAQRVLVESQP